MKRRHKMSAVNQSKKALFRKVANSSEIVLYVNRLSKDLGGSYLSNNDIQDDLSHYGPINRVLLLDNYWKNKNWRKIPDIEKHKIIFQNLWDMESIPENEQKNNIGLIKICSEVINNGINVLVILGHESLVWLVPNLKKIGGIKISTVHHGTPTHSLEEKGRRFKKEFIENLELLDFIIAVSPHLAKIILSFVSKKVIVLPNFPKLHNQSIMMKSEFSKNEIRILQISTMREIKRPYDGIELVRELSRNGVPVTLTIVGGNEVLAKYAKLSSSNISNGTIQVVPFAKRLEITKLITSHDFIFLPSAKEGFPRVSVEAMLCRKVIVVSQGANECGLIIDGKNGVVFQTGDIEDAAAKILRLYSSKEKYKSIVQNGSKTIKVIHKWRGRSIKELLQVIETWAPKWRFSKW